MVGTSNQQGKYTDTTVTQMQLVGDRVMIVQKVHVQNSCLHDITL